VKTILVRCTPDGDVVRPSIDVEAVQGACAWARIELPALALGELGELIEHFHAAPRPLIAMTALISIVMTVFEEGDDVLVPPIGEIQVLDGSSIAIPPHLVAETHEPPWVIIQAESVSFGIMGADPFVCGAPDFTITTIEVPYALLGLHSEQLADG